MPHLDSITIHNFKSFKHANIKFSKGFNCIVGANGSGKSNICDSLIFALGESSLKRMRVPNTAQLINSFAKPNKEDGLRKAYVKINFSGEQPLEIARIIKSNSKIGYRLNGKRATRQEVIDALRGYRGDINETNTITQGEISYMVNLNPKDRRELIDVAAGIKEFNDKKDTAMKELEKVQAKINETNIALNERKGFLDQLEKEKEDAEKYIGLTETVKRITYTVLKNSERQVLSDFEGISKTLKDLEQRKKAASSGIAELDMMLEKLSKDRESFLKNLNERSAESSTTGKVLEGINKQTAIKETEIKSVKEKMSELEEQSTQLKANLKKILSEKKAATDEADSVRKQLEEKAKTLSSKENAELEGAAGSQIEKIGGNQRRIEDLYLQLDNMSKKYLQYKFEIESAEKSLKATESAISPKSAEYEGIMSEIKKQKGIISNSEKRLADLGREIGSIKSKILEHQGTVDKIYVESVNLREQARLMGGGSDKVNDFLKKSIEKGFYGRAYELCRYGDKYAVAVNAAAASRLGYLVVDSAEVADKAIKLLKDRQLGRATFIPLKDVSLKHGDGGKGLDRLIDHVEYEEKFENAFKYIFANTYVARSIGDAKSIGFGKGRFVTLEGELVEQSGIITGGSTKHFQSPAMLESKIKSLEDQRFALSGVMAELGSEMDEKAKEAGRLQAEVLGCNVELKHLETAASALMSELEDSRRRSSELSSRVSELNGEYSESDSRRNSLLKELNGLKAENEKIYSLNVSLKHGNAKADKAALENLKGLRSEVESLRISIATLEKEQELKSARASELETQIKSNGTTGNEARKRLAILDQELQDLNAQMKEIRLKIGKSDANTQELYKKVQDLDSKISKLANDRGKGQLEIERANNGLIEQETRKVQLQTRISDIKAELMSYNGIDVVEGATMEELEAKRTIAKNDIERLGAVNLKAPEVYAAKKKDVEEVNSKMQVLCNEKDSVIAMVNEIESRKLSIFTETLNDVNENFKKLYGYVFEGSAMLQLDNQKDPFNSGLSINIKSPKHKNVTVEVLSGGEKSLVIIMLIFAIQAHDPMSLYVFDEIDAALDKENSKKLSRLMKEVSKKSQLIVISHNDSLITASDTAIGVVHRNGESRAVGLQITPTQSVEIK
ncbi:MAG: chromosome segregation protein SMC [Candidatus Micrarchaeota archaeon]|nr:chromosome segregation protein SMC [Candidatus Micrarchaeota archaeon]